MTILHRRKVRVKRKSRSVAHDHGEEVLVAELHNAAHLRVLGTERVGDGLEEDARLDEVIEAELRARVRVVASDHDRGERRRHVVAHASEGCKRIQIVQAVKSNTSVYLDETRWDQSFQIC